MGCTRAMVVSTVSGWLSGAPLAARVQEVRCNIASTETETAIATAKEGVVRLAPSVHHLVSDQ